MHTVPPRPVSPPQPRCPALTPAAWGPQMPLADWDVIDARLAVRYPGLLATA